jgi:hypothetical protein
MSKPTRRDFIKTGAGLIGSGLVGARMPLPVFDRMLPGATQQFPATQHATDRANCRCLDWIGLRTALPVRP